MHIQTQMHIQTHKHTQMHIQTHTNAHTNTQKLSWILKKKRENGIAEEKCFTNRR